jgi:opacity protein-like surface antigen
MRICLPGASVPLNGGRIKTHHQGDAMKTWRVFAAVAAALVIGTADAEAQAFGVQGNWGDDTDLGIGARLELGLPNVFTTEGPFSNTYFIGSFDWFFPDCDECTYWELNANLAVPITATTIDPYAGIGLNIAHVSVDVGGSDVSDTDVGLNLLGGLRFNLGTIGAFTEGRFELGGGEQFVLTFGVLLGGTR